MIQSHPGEFSAILVAIFWTITALSFESASNKVGSLPVNIIRLIIGFVFLSLLNLMIRGRFFPTDASVHNWIWLSVSGLIGFVLGDLFLFKSYTIIGSWFAMLMMTLAPPLAALFGWIILGETMDFKSLSGMTLTLIGITLALFSRDHENNKIAIRKPFMGILFAFFGALGQALGIVFSKYGMQDYSPFPSTQIRIITGIVGFCADYNPFRQMEYCFGSTERHEKHDIHNHRIILWSFSGCVLFAYGGEVYFSRNCIHHHGHGSHSDHSAKYYSFSS